MDFTKDTRLRQLALKSQEEKGDSIEKLLDVNDLVYMMPKNLSLASARNVKEYVAQKSSYASTESSVIITIQSGAQYVNWAASHLRFFLDITKNQNTVSTTWGKGSAFNLFREVIITSRSGQEICRLDRCNVYRLHKDRLHMSDEELASVGSLMGYDVDVVSGTNAPATTEWIIPMCKIAGCFDSKKLMPNWLASGLRIELRLETPATAFFAGADTVNSYTIVDPRVACDTFHLNDAAMKKLNEISARNGLEYVFQATHAVSDNFTTSQTTVDVNKAVSRALGCMAVSRQIDDIGATAVDSLKSETFDVDQSQFRLGSQYFPHQPLESLAEHYWNTLYTTEKLKSSHPSSVSLADYQSDYGVITTNLERSNILALSGLPINNSMTLSLDARFASPIVAGRQLTLFLEHVVVAKIFVNNVSIQE